MTQSGPYFRSRLSPLRPVEQTDYIKTLRVIIIPLIITL